MIDTHTYITLVITYNHSNYAPLWLKVDFRSKCEFFKPSQLLREGCIFSHIGACTCVHEPKTCMRGLFLIVECILEIGHGKTKYSLNIYLTHTQIQPHWSVRAWPISRSRMHFGDWSWKDEILIKYISNRKVYFSHVGVCMCMQEPKTRV